MTYEIEVGIPVPMSAIAAVRALATADIGSSVFFPGVKIWATSSLTCKVGGPGWTKSRTVDGGVRVWKIADPTKAVKP